MNANVVKEVCKKKALLVEHVYLDPKSMVHDFTWHKGLGPNDPLVVKAYFPISSYFSRIHSGLLGWALVPNLATRWRHFH